MLVAQLGIFVFLTLNRGPTGRDHVIVDSLEALSACDSIGEVLGGSLFLELLDFDPNGVWHIVVSSDRMQDLRQTKLLEEACHLLVLLRHLREFALDDALKDVFEFILKGTHCRWNDVTQLVIKVRLGVDFIIHRGQIDEVLRIELGHLADVNLGLVVNLLVVIDGLGQDTLSLGEFCRKIGQVGAAACLSKRLSLGVVLHAEGHKRHSLVHSSAIVRSIRVLEVSKLPVGHGLEVFRVIAKHIRKLAVVEAPQVRIDLVILKGFLEVDCDLCGDLGQHSRVHASIRGLFEEKILGLG